ncbi:hypothetical protein [Nocardioides sp. GXQ0305]|uniref:hypothetical protein n=1 Tax=Nocardioides sp. GXQ0305 TaxID=3423912 RepID=UPI003D7F0C66
MADRVVLHIGTMKSGTTYLQAVLTSGALDAVGGFYPGGRFEEQSVAVRRMLRPEHERDRTPWLALVDEVHARPGVAVFSQEFLSFARRRRVRQIVEPFGTTPIDVVLTVRDQRTAIPSQWQSFTRNRGTDDLATYVRRLSGPGGRRTSKALMSFRRAQDVPQILRRWTSPEAVRSVSVVVLPPPGSAPAELWRRFCDAAGLEVHDPPDAAVPANESLGYASCDALRRVNAHLLDLDRDSYRRARDLVLGGLLPLRAAEGRPELDRDGLALAADLNRAVVEAISSPGVRVVGSLDDLPVDPPAEGPATIAAPDEGEVLRALEAAWAAALPRQAPPSGGVEEVADRLGRSLAQRFGPAPRQEPAGT